MKRVVNTVSKMISFGGLYRTMGYVIFICNSCFLKLHTSSTQHTVFILFKHVLQYIYMHLICNQLQLIYKYGKKELKQSSKLVPIHKTFFLVNLCLNRKKGHTLYFLSAYPLNNCWNLYKRALRFMVIRSKYFIFFIPLKWVLP